MKTINISDETYESIKGQLGESEKIDLNELEDLVGTKVFIRTVTYHMTGKVRKIVGNFLVLDTPAWIADSGRFMNAIQKGELDEVEPTADGHMVNLGSVVDIIPWNHKLPTEQQ